MRFVSDELTTKQRLFVEAYIKDPNGVKAARYAGYKGSDIVLAGVARENIRKPHIAALLSKRVESAVMSADEALERLAALARNKPDTHIQVSDGKGGFETVEVKHADQIKALDMVMKYHGLYQQDRINQFNVKQVADAIRRYHEDHQDSDLGLIIDTFVSGRNVSRQDVVRALGDGQVIDAEVVQ